MGTRSCDGSDEQPVENVGRKGEGSNFRGAPRIAPVPRPDHRDWPDCRGRGGPPRVALHPGRYKLARENDRRRGGFGESRWPEQCHDWFSLPTLSASADRFATGLSQSLVHRTRGGFDKMASVNPQS